MQQFKVGDWVDYAGEFYRVHEEYNGKGNISKEVVNSLVRHDKNVQLWQPKEGEWVWYKKKKRNKLTNNVCELIRFYWDNVNIGDCEPFIGELPTFLKDK